jgi:hypothetical protein
MVGVEHQPNDSCTHRLESDQVGWYGVKCAGREVGGNIAATLHDVEIVAVCIRNIQVDQYEYFCSSAEPSDFKKVVEDLKLSKEEVSSHARLEANRYSTEGTRI